MYCIPKPKLGVFLLAAFAIAFSSCKKENPIPPYTPPDSSYGLIYEQILTPSCGVSGCHDGSSIHPRLSGENTYEAMVTSHVHNVEANAEGLHLVQAGHPENSFLYQKMIYDSSQYQFGSPMPAGGLTVSGNKIEFLRQWIVAGAPETGHVADRSLMD